jgi:hypothetical protein
MCDAVTYVLVGCLLLGLVGGCSTGGGGARVASNTIGSYSVSHNRCMEKSSLVVCYGWLAVHNIVVGGVEHALAPKVAARALAAARVVSEGSCCQSQLGQDGLSRSGKQPSWSDQVPTTILTPGALQSCPHPSKRTSDTPPPGCHLTAEGVSH